MPEGTIPPASSAAANAQLPPIDAEFKVVERPKAPAPTSESAAEPKVQRSDADRLAAAKEQEAQRVAREAERAKIQAERASESSARGGARAHQQILNDVQQERDIQRLTGDERAAAQAKHDAELKARETANNAREAQRDAAKAAEKARTPGTAASELTPEQRVARVASAQEAQAARAAGNGARPLASLAKAETGVASSLRTAAFAQSAGVELAERLAVSPPALNAAAQAAPSVAAQSAPAAQTAAAEPATAAKPKPTPTARMRSGLRGAGATGAVLGGVIALKELSEGDYKGAAQNVGASLGFWGGAETGGALAARLPIPHPAVKGGAVLVAGLIAGTAASLGGGELLSSMVDNPEGPPKNYTFVYDEKNDKISAIRTGKGWADKEGTAEALSVLELKEGGAIVILPDGLGNANLIADEKGKLYLQLPNKNDPKQPGTVVQIQESKDFEAARAEEKRVAKQRSDSLSLTVGSVGKLTPEQQTALAWYALNLRNPSVYKPVHDKEVNALADSFKNSVKDLQGFGAQNAWSILAPNLDLIHKNNVTIDDAVAAFNAAKGKNDIASFEKFITDLKTPPAPAPTPASAPAPAATGQQSGGMLSALSDLAKLGAKALPGSLGVIATTGANALPTSPAAKPAETPAAGAPQTNADAPKTEGGMLTALSDLAKLGAKALPGSLGAIATAGASLLPTSPASKPAEAPKPEATEQMGPPAEAPKAEADAPKPEATAPAAAAKTYTIGKGDSLSSIIAKEYEGVPNNGFGYIMLREAIKAANPDLNSSVASDDRFKLTIAIGTEIKLPTEEQVRNALTSNKISFDKAEAEICAALNCPKEGLAQAAKKQGISFAQ